MNSPAPHRRRSRQDDDSGPQTATAPASIPELVGEVYELAPAPLRIRLLDQLIRPLGVLSLVAVANGVFARIRLRNGWQDLRIGIDDAWNVTGSDVSALVEHVQCVSIEAVDGLAEWLRTSPALAASAAAALLVTALTQRARLRRGRRASDHLRAGP